MVGLGLMGSGIAQTAAQAGFTVVGLDTTDAAIATGQKRIHDSVAKLLSKSVEKGKMTQAAADSELTAIDSRLKFTKNVEDLKDVDLVIEVS